MNTARSVHLYSDIAFSSYQHVNQMLHRQLQRARVDSVFLDRMVMNAPSWGRIAALIKHRCTPRAQSSESPAAAAGVQRVINLPSLCPPLDWMNERLVRRQLPVLADTAVTFVPSRALKAVFDRYPELVYYCVHDAARQTYHRRNLAYERELVDRCRLVFCDNPIVLNRLARGCGYADLAQDPADHKFLLVPPPIPDCFFDSARFTNAPKKYDAVYFGSLHKDIDQQALRRLTDARLRVAVVSSQRLDFDNDCLAYLPLQTDFAALAAIVAQARCILLPYRNSDFMQTVSPAKIHQTIATGLPVLSSNRRLCTEYELMPMSTLCSAAALDRITSSYRLSATRLAELSRFRESVLLARVVHRVCGGASAVSHGDNHVAA